MPSTRKKLEAIRVLPTDMRDRAEYLLRNPRLGKKIIGKTEFGRRIFSNCYGTSVFLLGSDATKKCRQISKSQPPIFKDNPPIYYRNLSRPGFINVNTMQGFLIRNYNITRRPEPGDLAIIEKNNYDKYRLGHVAVWTGIENVVICQDGFGGKFQLNNFLSISIYTHTTYFASRKDQTP